MSISYWNISVLNSGGTYTADGQIPRPNQDLESEFISTRQKLRLANGDNAFVTPETSYVKEPIQFFFADTDSALRTKFTTYINNDDKVKIVTHSTEEFIGKFISMKRVWFAGVLDQYDLLLTFEVME